MEELVLAHHGILGQRWGKRNGPPYPLNESRKTVAEKTAKKRTGFSKAATLASAESKRQKAAARVEQNQKRLNKAKVKLDSGKMKVNKYLKKENKLMSRINEDSAKYDTLSKEIQEAVKLIRKEGYSVRKETYMYDVTPTALKVAEIMLLSPVALLGISASTQLTGAGRRDGDMYVVKRRKK